MYVFMLRLMYVCLWAFVNSRSYFESSAYILLASYTIVRIVVNSELAHTHTPYALFYRTSDLAIIIGCLVQTCSVDKINEREF